MSDSDSEDERRDPLGHLMQRQDSIVPSQPPSIIPGEEVHLSYSAGALTVSIDLALDASPGCGGIAWPAGEVLSRYLVLRGPEFVKAKNVLELGSGTGLCGLVAAAMGGKVVITDQAPLLPIMRDNIELNRLSAACKVVELNWGEPIPEDIPTPDIVLAADCVYIESAFPLLVQTLSDLVANGDTQVLFCYKKRRKADKRFFALLKKQFRWVDVEDDPGRSTYTREAISLLRLYKI
ncbi:unnamed protein product [Mycena citricolor]|uniref:Protein-lysine N-methyltransferase EFM6 n=1 Tax=Mycena citricolor TaxID=2018698 RepID=A0AAD2HJE3_9AGAR|nr:unnamed protein product [Mycena citricolor]